ncbi:MAG: hypothetical protein R2717_06590 [Schumannella sp.]
MVDATLRDGRGDRRSVFRALREAPPRAGRRYGIVAGTGRLLELLQDFRFGPDELSWLKREKVVSTRPSTESSRRIASRGRSAGTARGELYFPGSPLLVVEGTFAEAVVLETIALSVLNYDSAVASYRPHGLGEAEGGRWPRWDRAARAALGRRHTAPRPTSAGVRGILEPGGRPHLGRADRWAPPRALVHAAA